MTKHVYENLTDGQKDAVLDAYDIGYIQPGRSFRPGRRHTKMTIRSLVTRGIIECFEHFAMPQKFRLTSMGHATAEYLAARRDNGRARV